MIMLAKFFQKTLYIKIQSHCLFVKHIERNRYLEDIPLIALKHRGKKRIIAEIGSRARLLKNQPDIEVINPFEHKRLIFYDLRLAAHVITHFIYKLKSNPRISCTMAPRIIMHPLKKFEGGITEVEHFLLKQLAQEAGAYKSAVWDGAPLSDNEVLTFNFDQ